METDSSAKANPESTVASPPEAATAKPEITIEDLSQSEKGLQDRVTKLHAILGGDTTIAQHLQFLIRANKADLLILKNTKVIMII